MAESIDSLQIEISASSKSASAQIDALVKKMGELGGALKTIDTSAAVTNLNNLNNELKSLSSIKTSGLGTLAKQINQLGKMNIGNIAGMKAAISAFGDAMSGLNRVNVGAQIPQMAQLASSISRLGNKSAATAIANMPQLASGLKDMMKSLSSAPKVSQNLIDMTNALAKFAKTGSSGVKAATSLGNSVKKMGTKFASVPGIMNSFNASLKKSVSSIANLRRGILSSIGVVGGLYGAIAGIKASIEAASDLTEVQNVIDVTFAQYKDVVEKMASMSIPNLGISEIAAKETAGRFQAMGVASGIARKKMAEMSVTLTELSADMASFYNESQADVAKSLQSVFTGETEPLRKYGVDLTQATLKEWAMKRGLDANIASMSQAEKAMLRYEYVLANTTSAQGDFLRTQNTWSNQIKVLRMQLQQLAATLGTAFVNALKPLISALNKALAAIIQFAATVINALGKIFGWTATISSGKGIADDYGDAAGSAGDLADNTGKAASNAKKLKSHLLAIDELNVVEPDTDSAGGGGGAGGGLSTAGVGAAEDLIKIEETENPFESTIENLEELGSYIGDALKTAMDSIKWDEIYEKASNFGAGLASFLNGLISPELFASLGTTIANAINTALTALNSFGETFDWGNFGVSIATGINSFFSSFDWGLLADTINAWAKGLLDALISALETIDWKLIGTSIGTFLAGIDFADIGKKLVEAIWLAIKGAWEAVEASFDVAPIETALLLLLASPVIVGFGSNLVSALVTPIKSIGTTITTLLAPVGTAVSNLGLALTTASAPAVALGAALATLAVGLGVTYAKNEDVRKSFHEATSAIKDGLQPAIEFISDKVIPDLQAAWDGLKEIMSPLADFISGVFVSIWQDMINPALTTIGKEVLPAVTSAFEALWNNVLVPLGEFIGAILKPVIESLSKILTTLWKNVVVPLAQAVGEVFVAAFQGACDIFVAATGKVKSVINILKNLWDNVLTPLGTFIAGTFKPIFEKAFDVIKQVITNAKTAFKGLVNFITGVFTGNWKKAWTGVKDVFRGVFNSIVAVAESAINGIVKGLNSFLGGFNKVVSSVGDKVGLNISIPTIPTVKLPRFATGGFPEDGLFMANSRELVGKFSNGKTAVANNEQIIEGIKRGVKEAIAEDLLPYLSQISQNISQFLSNGFNFGGTTQKNQSAGSYTTVDDLLTSDVESFSVAAGGLQELKTSLDFEAVKEATVSALSAVQEMDFSDWFKNNVAAWFDSKLWNDTLQVIPDAVQAAVTSAQDVLTVLLNNIIGAVEQTVNNAVDAINALIRAMNSVPGVTARVSEISRISLERITIPELDNVEVAIASDVQALTELAGGQTVGRKEIIDFGGAQMAVELGKSMEESAYLGFSKAYKENTRDAELLERLISEVHDGKDIIVDGRSLVRAYDTRKARNGFSFT